MSRIEGEKEVLANLDKLQTKMVSGIKDIVNINCLLLETNLKQTVFMPGSPGARGFADGLLYIRSGQFKRSIQMKKAEVNEEKVSGGIGFGTIYGRVHVGPRGQETTILPKRVKFLTIPLSAAQGPHGQTKGGARDRGVYGETFVATSKKGNLLIYGKTKYVKGKRAGQTRGDIVPLFLLVKQSKIKSRLHPEDMIKWVRPKIENDIREELK